MKLFVVRTRSGDVFFKGKRKNRRAALKLAVASALEVFADPASEYDKADRELLLECQGDDQAQWMLLREWKVLQVARTIKRKDKGRPPVGSDGVK